MKFEKTSQLTCSIEQAFAWHEQEGALERLSPRWQTVTATKDRKGIAVGTQVDLKLRMFGIPLVWKALHTAYEKPILFEDTQLSGPFHRWVHRHQFKIIGNGTEMQDRVDYAPHGGALGAALFGQWIRNDIDRLFAYRHKVMKNDLTVISTYALPKMRILISGASGLIGKTLKAFLDCAGHEVVSLVRSQPKSSSEIQWNPLESLDPKIVTGFDAVIHLSGENVASGRWNEARKKIILDSRTLSTSNLVRALNSCERPPRVFLCASAIGIYGSREDAVIDEGSARGSGFLADVTAAWELEAKKFNGRSVFLRTGIVLDPQGGALAKMLPAFKIGIAGALGPGTQWMSWIDIHDEIYAIYHCLAKSELEGPVNLVSPNPVTNDEFTRTLAHTLGRTTGPRMPAVVLKTMFGEMAEEMFLASTRAVPKKLTESGFRFFHPNLGDSLRFLLGK